MGLFGWACFLMPCQDDADLSWSWKSLANVVAAEVLEDLNAASETSVKGFVKLETSLPQGTYKQPMGGVIYGELVSEKIKFRMVVVEDSPLEISSLSVYLALIGFELRKEEEKTHYVFWSLLLQPEEGQANVFTRLGYGSSKMDGSEGWFEATEKPSDLGLTIKHFERREITLIRNQSGSRKPLLPLASSSPPITTRFPNLPQRRMQLIPVTSALVPP
jgi:hypothetical protein